MRVYGVLQDKCRTSGMVHLGFTGGRKHSVPALYVDCRESWRSVAQVILQGQSLVFGDTMLQGECRVGR